MACVVLAMASISTLARLGSSSSDFSRRSRPRLTEACRGTVCRTISLT
ncbi:Uncharacterised protein [Bordetella pertussis]|nr:Uncharacterised protein [Bordetella pertussis]CFP66366.1 Uncharacterised protein [Bordetella pertussis]